MKMTSAYANKLLKQLDEEKSYLLSMEKSGNTYIAESRENAQKPDYDYRKTQDAVERIDNKIMKIKHAVNLSNITSGIEIGGNRMAVDEILVRMAQLNKRKAALDAMRKIRDGERQGRGIFDSGPAVTEYKYLNYSIDEVQEDYRKISEEIMRMQLALDRHNQIDEFEVEI